MRETQLFSFKVSIIIFLTLTTAYSENLRKDAVIHSLVPPLFEAPETFRNTEPAIANELESVLYEQRPSLDSSSHGFGKTDEKNTASSSNLSTYLKRFTDAFSIKEPLVNLISRLFTTNTTSASSESTPTEDNIEGWTEVDHFEDDDLEYYDDEAQFNSTNIEEETPRNETIHEEINRMLGDDEERVLSRGTVQVRKKRQYCRRRCFATVRYGYGGRGGCCAYCGGGCRRYRPAYRRAYVVRRRPFYDDYYDDGCCGPPACAVCGR